MRKTQLILAVSAVAAAGVGAALWSQRAPLQAAPQQEVPLQAAPQLAAAQQAEVLIVYKSPT